MDKKNTIPTYKEHPTHFYIFDEKQYNKKSKNKFSGKIKVH